MRRNVSLAAAGLLVMTALRACTPPAMAAVSYLSGDLRITGVMNIPRGRGPFPVVVLAHGYIDPRIYASGQGFRREQDALARRGYAVQHVDYRNHAGSDRDPGSDAGMRLGYAEDVVNAAMAVRRSSAPEFDRERVGLLGRSMGGGVGLTALVMAPDACDAAVFYAATSSDPVDNVNRWMRDDPRLERAILTRFKDPAEDRSRWDLITARKYFSNVRTPIVMFHGTADESCPIAWARATYRALRAVSAEATLIEYAGAPHDMLADWPDSMRRSLAFFDRALA